MGYDIDDFFEIEQLRKELEAVKNRVCEWKIETDEFANNYETGCENIFTIIDGTPEDNEFAYCPYCGGKIKIKRELEKILKK